MRYGVIADVHGNAHALDAVLAFLSTQDLDGYLCADPQECVTTEAHARSCLEPLARAEPAARILVVGHTHRPMAVSRRRGGLLRSATGDVELSADDLVRPNPGAVGQSRTADPRARVMVVDTEARVAGFHAVDYDVAGCRRALRERGLPARSCHLRRSRRSAAARLLSRQVRRLLRLRQSAR
jgi:diadenosine tetraphosphatase ApaH/serine/threonine PP2A family protein phosphatase